MQMTIVRIRVAEGDPILVTCLECMEQLDTAEGPHVAQEHAEANPGHTIRIVREATDHLMAGERIYVGPGVRVVESKGDVMPL